MRLAEAVHWLDLAEGIAAALVHRGAADAAPGAGPGRLAATRCAAPRPTRRRTAGGPGEGGPRAGRPNRRGVAGVTFVSTWAGTAYTGFVIDAFSLLIAGWRTAASHSTDLVLDARAMGGPHLP